MVEHIITLSFSQEKVNYMKELQERGRKMKINNDIVIIGLSIIIILIALVFVAVS